MAWPTFAFPDWIFAILAAYFIGMGKAGFAGIGTLAIILFAFIMPARESTGAILPMLIIADILAVRALGSHVRWEYILRLLPASLTGVVIGFFLMPHVSDEAFSSVIGWTILALTVLILIQRAIPALQQFAAAHPAVGIPTGIGAGITTMLANAAGPITTLYFLACRLPRMNFVGTAAWYYLIVNVIKVPFSAGLGLITWPSLTLNVLLAPLILLGVLTGKWLLGKISQTVFEWLMIGFALLGAARLIWQ